ncbi:HD domain-containing protein [Nocardioides pakistanensis]
MTAPEQPLHRPLENQWPGILAAHGPLRDELVAAYAEDGRGYHDVRHLTEVLAHLDMLLAQPAAAGVDPTALRLAAWFHDAVYDGHRDDEERSAVLAEERLGATGVPDPLVAEVARLVRLTADHRPGPGDVAGALLCDADLAVLASGPERYAEYVRGVRKEYADLDEDTFRAGRAGVLRALLEGPTLFHSPLAQELWEAAARANVQRELESLEAPR